MAWEEETVVCPSGREKVNFLKTTQAIDIIHTSDKATADELAKQGYEPIECSFGAAGSSLGELAMDHHGAESWREGVALRAYRDHFGSRKDDARFVVTGAADADATFAIAALCGLLPHPSRVNEFEKAPPPVKAAGTRDISALAGLVNQVDTAPIGVRLEETDNGVTLLLWNQLSSSVQDATAFHSGVDRWRGLLGRAPKALLAAAKTEEELRVAEARKAKVTKISDEVAVVESAVWGFDVWYAEAAPVIVAFVAANANVTIGAPDTEVAEKLLGNGGLKNVFGAISRDLMGACEEEAKKAIERDRKAAEEAGKPFDAATHIPSEFAWGGRESIGGSPRGRKMTLEQTIEVAKRINAAIVRAEA